MEKQTDSKTNKTLFCKTEPHEFSVISVHRICFSAVVGDAFVYWTLLYINFHE